VRDYKKVLVNAWKIADDSSNVFAFDKKGKLIFRKDGKLTAEEIRTLIKVIAIIVILTPFRFSVNPVRKGRF